MKVKIFSETSENTTGQSVTTQMNRISSTAAVRITNLAENTLHFTVQTTKVIHEFQQWYISFFFILASYVRQFRREVSTQGKKVSKSLFCHSTSSATWNSSDPELTWEFAPFPTFSKPNLLSCSRSPRKYVQRYSFGLSKSVRYCSIKPNAWVWKATAVRQKSGLCGGTSISSDQVM